MSAAKNGSGDTSLLGWLVSYELDQEGFSFEIREGRTLISADGTTAAHFLSLNEKSISSPHAALLAQEYHKVMLQDIFSEHGCFLTRAGDEKEVPIDGPVAIAHGDWIRIGNKNRFQVCLIDDPGNQT